MQDDDPLAPCAVAPLGRACSVGVMVPPGGSWPLAAATAAVGSQVRYGSVSFKDLNPQLVNMGFPPVASRTPCRGAGAFHPAPLPARDARRAWTPTGGLPLPDVPPESAVTSAGGRPGERELPGFNVRAGMWGGEPGGALKVCSENTVSTLC